MKREFVFDKKLQKGLIKTFYDANNYGDIISKKDDRIDISMINTLKHDAFENMYSILYRADAPLIESAIEKLTHNKKNPRRLEKLKRIINNPELHKSKELSGIDMKHEKINLRKFVEVNKFIQLDTSKLNSFDENDSINIYRIINSINNDTKNLNEKTLKKINIQVMIF